jgi:hypothetical protein
MTPEVQDSIYSVHPRMRAHWLKERGIDLPGFTSPFYPDSLNMTCVGRWSYGPSYDITGKADGNDTIVFLARGSGVSVLQFHGGSHPSVSLLSDINAMGLVNRVAAQDSWLMVGSSGFEIYNVAQPTNPVKASWTNVGINDLAVQDSFLYVTSNESLTVFNIANKVSPYRVGACSDSGSTIAVCGNKAFLIWGTYGWRGMYILDISNPAAPHRVGIWNSTVGSVAAQRNLCYVSDAGRFHILNAANPASPQELSSIGVGGNIYLDGNYAYLSSFATIDVTDSLMPGIVGQCSLAVGGTTGIWATGLYGNACVACGSDGFGILDLSDPVRPTVDSTGLLAYDDSRDIFVQGAHAIVANDQRGARLLNVADPTHPLEIAAFDTAGAAPQCDAARLTDSLVYMGWWGYDGWRGLYISNYADSTGPSLLGKCATLSPINAMALKDSFLFAAGQTKFQLLSIQDPTHPSVVSTCSLGFMAMTRDLCLNDSIAYVANTSGGLRMIDVTQPHSATALAYYIAAHDVYSVAVRDSIAFLGTDRDLRIVNVRDPQAPFEIGSLATQGMVRGISVKGSRILITNRFAVLDISDPSNPRTLGFYETPLSARRLVWTDSLVYSCCYEGGIIILRTGDLSVCEEDDDQDSVGPTRVDVFPNPTSGECWVHASTCSSRLRLYGLFDPSGRLVSATRREGTDNTMLDLVGLRPGIYFLKGRVENSGIVVKITRVN